MNAADNFPAQELKRGNEAHEVLEDLDYPDLTAKREELLQRLTQILEVNFTQNYTGTQFLDKKTLPNGYTFCKLILKFYWLILTVFKLFNQ